MKAGDNLGNSGILNLASEDYARGYNSAEKKYKKLLKEQKDMYLDKCLEMYKTGRKDGYMAGAMEQL